MVVVTAGERTLRGPSGGVVHRRIGYERRLLGRTRMSELVHEIGAAEKLPERRQPGAGHPLEVAVRLERGQPAENASAVTQPASSPSPPPPAHPRPDGSAPLRARSAPKHPETD